MLKKFLFLLVSGLALLVAVGLFLPTTYDVERAVVINASPQQIHPYVNNLQEWQK